MRGFGENEPRGVTVFGASGGELLERPQAAEQSGELVLPVAIVTGAGVAIGACTGKLRFTCGPLDPQGVHRIAGASHRLFSGGKLE